MLNVEIGYSMKSIGMVKWFGGINSKTNRENKFGFITDQSGKDIFLHKNECEGQYHPDEDDVVCYTLEEDKGKWKAVAARPFRDVEYEPDELFLLIKTSVYSSSLAKLKKALNSQFVEVFYTAKNPMKLALFGNTQDTELMCELLYCDNRWFAFLELIKHEGLFKPLDDIDWKFLPNEFFKNHEDKVAEYLINHQKSKVLALQYKDKLPVSLILFLVIKDNTYSVKELGGRFGDLSSYIGEMVKEGTNDYPSYIHSTIKNESNPIKNLRDVPILRNIIDVALFKKYCFEKNTKFSLLYDASDYLKSRFDIFILNNLCSLMLANNNQDLIYQVFLNKLWTAITSKAINPIAQMKQLQRLFPSCSTMPKGLACEAVYWKKQEKFLCRGKECLDPKVIPHTTHDYFYFTIYDWFAHYGIDYLNESEPTTRDFPIKLAGYLNRMIEIFDVIHCRSCSSLMIPNLKYSRVEYTVVENGKFIQKDMAASYRLTVFKCPNTGCLEYGTEHYINHCLGFDCYEIIDTRDLKVKCDSGLYICRGCGSCCGTHSKSNPAGLCPDCGKPLNLYEASSESSFGQRMFNSGTSTYRKDRFARCSSSTCNFYIPKEKLSKKFYLQSSGDPIKVRKN